MCVYMFLWPTKLSMSMCFHLLACLCLLFIRNFCRKLLCHFELSSREKRGNCVCRKLWSPLKCHQNHRAGVKWACGFPIAGGKSSPEGTR